MDDRIFVSYRIDEIKNYAVKKNHLSRKNESVAPDFTIFFAEHHGSLDTIQDPEPHSRDVIRGRWTVVLFPDRLHLPHRLAEKICSEQNKCIRG